MTCDTDLRRISAILLALTLSAAAAAQVALAASTDSRPDQRLADRLADGVLRWGGDAEGGAPFELPDPEDPGRVIGFEVELADALAASIARRLGRPLHAEFVQYEWVSLPLGLAKGDFDIILSGYEITPESRRSMRFSRPYYLYAEQLVVRRDERLIGGLHDCQGRLVGTMAGSAAERLLKRAGIDTVSFDGQVEPYLDLELGRLDAVLLDTPIVTFYGETNPHFKLVGGQLAEGAYGIAARPGDVELIAAIDEALSDLMASGRLRHILVRWHLWNNRQARLAAGPRRRAELMGLGFDQAGHANPKADKPKSVVDRNLVATAGQQGSWRQYTPLLLRAAGMTLFLTVSSMSVAVVLGLLVVVARLYGPAPVRWAALTYVEFFRGIPLLLVLFFLYFGLAHYLAEWHLNLPAVYTAIVGFGLNYAAYESEIYRASIEAVPLGQWEAARALGMPGSTTFRRIILPQAVRTALGPMTNDLVALFKDTSLVSVIAVRELTKEYLILSRSSLKFVELGLLTAVLYLAMSVPLGYLSRYLEKRWRSGAGR